MIVQWRHDREGVYTAIVDGVPTEWRAERNDNESASLKWMLMRGDRSRPVVEGSSRRYLAQRLVEILRRPAHEAVREDYSTRKEAERSAKKQDVPPTKVFRSHGLWHVPARESDSATTILVKGGRVDLYLENESSPVVLPPDYGLVHDPNGRDLDKCSLFVGPIEVTDEPISQMSPEAVEYFGSDYEARKAFLDVPNEGWNLVGRVVEIVYFRPGKLEDDWRHKFDAPQELYRSGDWYLLRFPEDCKLTHRGIEKP